MSVSGHTVVPERAHRLNQQLVDQHDWHWQHHVRSRWESLIDDEYFWEPVPGCWNVRRPGAATAPIQIGSGDRSINYQSFDYAGTAAAALRQLDADTRQCQAGASVSGHRNGDRAPATNRRPDQYSRPGHHRRCSRRRRVAVSVGAAREHCRRGSLEFCDRSVRFWWMRFPRMSASRAGLSWRCRDSPASRRSRECSTSDGFLGREQCHRLP